MNRMTMAAAAAAIAACLAGVAQVQAQGGTAGRWTQCVKTTTQVKEGQVEAAPGKMVFAISGGSEKWQSSCGDSGVGKISPAREAYDAAVQGSTLRLSSGPSRWTFTRG